MLGKNELDYRILCGLAISSIICVAGLIIWWRHGLTALYRERNIQKYEEDIAEKDGRIQKLEGENEFLAALIHKDRKLLPAMYHTVKALYNQEIADAEVSWEIRGVMGQLETYMEERFEAVTRNLNKSKVLPGTGDKMIDGLLSAMLAKASQKDIQFDLNVFEIVSELPKALITATNLRELLADLIENAVAAASCSAYKKIFITLGADERCYEMSIQDSGIPFAPETYEKLGKEETTTHSGNGGSGKGFMQIFEILQACNASLIITEYEPIRYGFSKSVKVRFDNKCEHLVHTFRDGKPLTLQIGPGKPKNTTQCQPLLALRK